MSEIAELPAVDLSATPLAEAANSQTYKDALIAAIEAIPGPENSGFLLVVALRPGDGTVDSSGGYSADPYALVCILQNLCGSAARGLAEQAATDKDSLSSDDRKCMDALHQASRTFRLVTGIGRRSEEPDPMEEEA